MARIEGVPRSEAGPMIKLAGAPALVNMDRFNAAFGIGAAGFSEGMVCVPPDRPPAGGQVLAQTRAAARAG